MREGRCDGQGNVQRRHVRGGINIDSIQAHTAMQDAVRGPQPNKAAVKETLWIQVLPHRCCHRHHNAGNQCGAVPKLQTQAATCCRATNLLLWASYHCLQAPCLPHHCTPTQGQPWRGRGNSQIGTGNHTTSRSEQGPWVACPPAERRAQTPVSSQQRVRPILVMPETHKHSQLLPVDPKPHQFTKHHTTQHTAAHAAPCWTMA